jgi:hypothetical protein
LGIFWNLAGTGSSFFLGAGWGGLLAGLLEGGLLLVGLLLLGLLMGALLLVGLLLGGLLDGLLGGWLGAFLPFMLLEGPSGCLLLLWGVCSAVLRGL